MGAVPRGRGEELRAREVRTRTLSTMEWPARAGVAGRRRIGLGSGGRRRGRSGRCGRMAASRANSFGVGVQLGEAVNVVSSA